jgi:molybdopterin-containing oxidoreductase family membrane subunit
VIAPGTPSAGHRQDQRDSADANDARVVVGFLFAFALANVLLLSITQLLVKGVGIWGVKNPVGWGFAIVNFVWWIGIGHAGTLISVILLLPADVKYVDQPVRRGDDAVCGARAVVLIHMGWPWVAHGCSRLNVMGLAPVCARWCGTSSRCRRTRRCRCCSGLSVPDLATLRDRSPRGPRHLRHAGNGLARIGTPLAPGEPPTCCSPGWRRRCGVGAQCRELVRDRDRAGLVTRRSSPPYFVAGAIYSGFAMVLTLAIPSARSTA